MTSIQSDVLNCVTYLMLSGWITVKQRTACIVQHGWSCLVCQLTPHAGQAHFYITTLNTMGNSLVNTNHYGILPWHRCSKPLPWSSFTCCLLTVRGCSELTINCWYMFIRVVVVLCTHVHSLGWWSAAYKNIRYFDWRGHSLVISDWGPKQSILELSNQGVLGVHWNYTSSNKPITVSVWTTTQLMTHQYYHRCHFL